MKRFSDFASDEIGLVGKKLTMQDILGKPIIVTAGRIAASKAVKGKQCLQLQFTFDGAEEPFVVFTNSSVLIKQMTKYGEEVPFLATIEKHGAYYTFS